MVKFLCRAANLFDSGIWMLRYINSLAAFFNILFKAKYRRVLKSSHTLHYFTPLRLLLLVFCVVWVEEISLFSYFVFQILSFRFSPRFLLSWTGRCAISQKWKSTLVQWRESLSMEPLKWNHTSNVEVGQVTTAASMATILIERLLQYSPHGFIWWLFQNLCVNNQLSSQDVPARGQRGREAAD